MEKEWVVGVVLHPKSSKKCGYTVYRYLGREGVEIGREMTQHIYDTEADARCIANMLNLGAEVWRYCDGQRRILLEKSMILQKTNKTKAANAREVSAAYADIMDLITSMT